MDWTIFWDNWGREIIAGLIGGGSVLGVGKIFLEGRVKKNIDAHAERLKYDFQKELLHAEVVTKNRHEIYSELFKLVCKADGAINALSGFRFEASFEEYSPEDFEKVLEKWDVKTLQKNKIMDTFTRNRDEGIEEWRKYRKVLEISDANISLTEARNFYFLNMIYLSEEVIKTSKELIDNMAHCLTFLRMDDHIKNWGKFKSFQGKIKEGLEIVRNKMRKDLGIQISE